VLRSYCDLTRKKSNLTGRQDKEDLLHTEYRRQVEPRLMEFGFEDVSFSRNNYIIG